LIPRGYTLDADGIPSFRYELGAARVEDRVESLPDAKGLRRRISWMGAPTPAGQWRLGAGETITDLGKGRYLIAGRYYVQIPAKSKTKLTIQEGEAGQELVVTATEGNQLEYDIIW